MGDLDLGRLQCRAFGRWSASRIAAMEDFNDLQALVQ